MKTSKKAIIQAPEGRGFMNGNSMKISNHSGEITYNVALGKNTFSMGYEMLGQLKFATVEDAKEYVDVVGASEGVVEGKEYYAITKQDGCAFMSIGFYSVK